LFPSHDRWGAQLFKNGARPSGILSTEQKLSEAQYKLLSESWTAAHGGTNALGTAVLDSGVSWSSLVMNNKDAQFLETRKFQISEIARLYEVPPHMIGDLERSTYSNIEQQSLEFVKYSLMSWLGRWESAIDARLITVDGVYSKFVVNGLLRGDVKTRNESYQIGRQNGWLSVNEIRELEDMDPIEGGDDYTPAANLYQEKGSSDVSE
jgi:HK97 family phage portal protein